MKEEFLRDLYSRYSTAGWNDPEAAEGCISFLYDVFEKISYEIHPKDWDRFSEVLVEIMACNVPLSVLDQVAKQINKEES